MKKLKQKDRSFLYCLPLHSSVVEAVLLNVKEATMQEIRAGLYTSLGGRPHKLICDMGAIQITSGGIKKIISRTKRISDWLVLACKTPIDDRKIIIKVLKSSH